MEKQKINLMDNIREYDSLFAKLNNISSHTFTTDMNNSILDKLSYIGSIANYGMTAKHVLESEYTFAEAVFIHMHYPNIQFYNNEHDYSLVSIMNDRRENTTLADEYEKFSDAKFHISINIALGNHTFWTESELTEI